jgi:putative ABC transport system permease protein
MNPYLLVEFCLLIVKNVRRNMVRSSLTALGTMVLVLVVTLVWSVLAFLHKATQEKSKDLKLVITEKWQIPSQMPFSYAASLTEGGYRADHPDDVKPLDSMTWQFYGGSLDLKNRTLDNTLFAFALEPIKLITMMDELDSLPPDKKATFKEVVDKLTANRQGLIVGRDKLRALNKRVGDRFTLQSMNYKDIDLEFEVVGIFPPGRYDNSCAMNRDYLLAALDDYQQKNKRPHPLMDKTLNLVWLRVADTEMYAKIDEQIESSPSFSTPAVKCETAASGISTFLDSYRDMIFGMRYFLSPAALVTMALVISNAISISVRERRMEIAVLKVLGFRPYQILCLVLGESLFLGVLAGFASSALTFVVINYWFGGLKFPIAFFAAFMIPAEALWWGPAIGALTALAGSIVPAWSARSVKVSEVFSKVA